MLVIDDKISIPENELSFTFIRAAGPGGQNVNKVASAVQLRFYVASSSSLGEEVKHRLVKIAGKRMNNEGELVIEAKRFRTQEQNKQDALDRLARLIHKALERPKKRKKTEPSLADREERLQQKRHRSQLKSSRKAVRENRE